MLLTTKHLAFIWLVVCRAFKGHSFFISHLSVTHNGVCDDGHLSLHAYIQAALVILEMPVLAHISILAKDRGLDGTLEGLLVQASNHLLLAVDLLVELSNLVLVDVLLSLKSDVLFFETL